jgi:hypothetical protein
MVRTSAHITLTPILSQGCSLRISPFSHLFRYAKVAERSELHSIAMDVSFRAFRQNMALSDRGLTIIVSS